MTQMISRIKKYSRCFFFLLIVFALTKNFTGQPLKEARASEESFSFVAIPDSESSGGKFNSELNDIIKQASKKDSDFAVFTGDIIMTTGGKLNDYYDSIKTVKNKMDSNFNKSYIVFGKHDIQCGYQCINLWFKIFWNRALRPQEKAVLYHSFDYKNTHVVLLSTDYPKKHSIDNEQLSWLDNDLASTNKPNKIVFSHVPPITFFKESAEECHDMSCDESQQAKLINIFKKHKVDLVISGHEHNFAYKVANDIPYIISGNAGNGERYGLPQKDIFTYVKIDGEKIDIEAIEKNGDTVREIEVK